MSGPKCRPEMDTRGHLIHESESHDERGLPHITLDSPTRKVNPSGHGT